MNFVSYLSFLTFGIGILFSIYLIVRFKQFRSTFFLLAIIFSICWVEFYMYALSSHEILHLPFLYRTAFPFRSLIPVFLWLYIWSMLNPSKAFQWKQYLHFIIPLFITVALIPDFIKPSAEKIATFIHFYSQNNLLLNKPAGILPAKFIQPFTIVFSLIYTLYTVFYIRSFLRKKDLSFRNLNKVVIQWLQIVSITISIFIIFQGTQYLTILIGGYFNSIAQIIQSASLIYMKCYLLVTPLVIENMDGCIEVVSSQSNIENLTILPDLNHKAENDPSVNAILSYLNNDKNYLLEDLTITKMAIDLGLSKQKLSKIIQREYLMSFSELINRYRIHHFIELSRMNTQLKMEFLIKESGFSQRSTFYSVFKKYTGTNPSVFIKSIKSSN